MQTLMRQTEKLFLQQANLISTYKKYLNHNVIQMVFVKNDSTTEAS